MSIVEKVVGGLFGSKSERDLKELQPWVDKINVETDRISGMSNDQLRAESVELKKLIRESIAAEQEEIAGLKVQLDDPRMDVDEKERLYQQVEKIEKTADETFDRALEEGLPLAFAIIKETARRFKENESLEVTANDYDRDLAA
ncbi:MAG: preprotein translocase subunit SecA, partial [Bacteroidales bacterium]|nr:preprotein translocase subunit SecA [Bacteroidales bacterium]